MPIFKSFIFIQWLRTETENTIPMNKNKNNKITY